MSSSSMKPIIAIAMAEPVDPLGTAYSIPNALRSMAAARERVAVQRFIRYLVEHEHPFASDAFQERRMAKLTRLMERMYGYDSEEAARELEGVRSKIR